MIISAGAPALLSPRVSDFLPLKNLLDTKQYGLSTETALLSVGD